MGRTEDAIPLMLGKLITEGGEEGGLSLHHPASWGAAHPPYSTSTFFSPESAPVWPTLGLGDVGVMGDREGRGSHRGSRVTQTTLLRMYSLTRLFYGIEIPFPQPPFHLTKTRVISQFCSCLPPSPLRLKKRKKSTSCKAKAPYVRFHPSFCFVEFFGGGAGIISVYKLYSG